MKFLFCNFLDQHMKRKNTKGVIHVMESTELSEGVQEAEAYLIDNGTNGTKVLTLVKVGEQVGGEKIELIDHVEGDLVHTEENPIILVATRKFKVFKGIPTRIKYIPVDGGVLVALIQGYISVEDKSGDMIPLSRNYDAYSGDEGHVFTAEEVYGMNLLEDKESDVKYSDHVVNDCTITLKVAKDGSKIKSVKFDKESFVFLHTEVFEKGKERKEAKLKAAEEKKLQRAAEIAEFTRRQAEVVAPSSESMSKKTKGKKKEDVVTDSSLGAKSFLDIVNGLKK